MNIVVLVKQVPDTYSERKLAEGDHTLDRDAADAVLDEINERAVEEALLIKEAQGGEVTVLCVGPDRATDEAEADQPAAAESSAAESPAAESAARDRTETAGQDTARRVREHARWLRDEAQRVREEAGARFTSGTDSDPPPGWAGRPSWTEWPGRRGWEEWTRTSGRRGWTGALDFGTLKDLERVAVQFTADLRKLAMQSGVVGENVITDLRTILEEALERIKTEIFGSEQGPGSEAEAPAPPPAEKSKDSDS